MMLKWHVANVFSMCVLHFDLRTLILTFFFLKFLHCAMAKRGWGAWHLSSCRVYATATDDFENDLPQIEHLSVFSPV